MRWDARGTIALLLSALVGIAAGVVLGFSSTGNSPPGSADPDDPSPSSSASGTPQDPLGIGASLVNQDCTTKKILVVGSGSGSGELSNAVSANPPGEVKYLKTSDSCDTFYGPDGATTPPEYVVYLGPFDSNAEPCGLRMSVDHKDDAVTSLKKGQDTFVPCLCVLRPKTFPKLTVGMEASTLDGIYTRALQEMLLDAQSITADHVTGRYDEYTAREVEKLQKLNALSPSSYGRVNTPTWIQIRDRGCIAYDF
jgi:hypothetical protein